MVRSWRFALSLVCVVLLTSAVVPVSGDTYWQHEPSTPGDWSVDSNWTAGVPQEYDWAYIDNGGTALISSGAAKAYHLFVGYSDGSAVAQSGGIVTIGSPDLYNCGELYIGNGGAASYDLDGGRLEARLVSVGTNCQFTHTGGVVDTYGTSYGRGTIDVWGDYELSGGGQITTANLKVARTEGNYHFIQTGGTVEVTHEFMLSRYSSYEGTYELVDGSLSSASSYVRHGGLFAQSGGSHTISEELVVCGKGSLPATYTLTGGLLSAASERVGQRYCDNGEFHQSGGTNRVGYLEVLSGFRYEFTGGQLEVRGGVGLEGEFDFTGNELTLTAVGGSLLNFGKGSIVNADQATLEVGPDSLVIFAPGVDPNTLFKSYSNAGITHTHGNTLDLAVGQRVAGWGNLDDHVNCQGQIEATLGGWINLNAGLTISSGGSVDLKGGSLHVEDQISGIDDGTLSMNWMCVGRGDGAASFTQSGGNNTIENRLYVGYDSSTSATYELSGTAQLSATIEHIGGYWGSGAFIQTGGTNTVSDILYIGDDSTAGTYELSGTGQLSTATTHLTGKDAVFTQTGGSHATGDLKLEDEATYQLSGGRLVTGNVFLGADYFDEVSFIQTGGTHTVEGELVIARKGYNNSSYTLSSGELAACQLWIGEGSTGIFTQSGGSNTTCYLGVYWNGTYEYKGGSLIVDGGLHVSGILDLGDQDVTIDVLENSIVNLSEATFQNAGNGELNVGGNSLVILSAGMDPLAIFRNYSNAGLTHIAGSTLVLEPGQSFSGIGTFTDNVECRGTINGRENGFLVFGRTSYDEGLHVSAPGVVDASGGSLTLLGSGPHVQYGGSIVADSFFVKTNYKLKDGDVTCETAEIGWTHQNTGLVEQTGGTFTVSGTMLVHERGDCVGFDGYRLSGGVLSVGNLCIGGGNCSYNENAEFLHWGGTNIVDRLVIAPIYNDALYEIRDATLVIGSLIIGDGGFGTFRIADSDAHISVIDSLLIGFRGEFVASSGSEIHMIGSSFENYSEYGPRLHDLCNLNLIFEGGAAHWSTFEVAGACDGGFDDNFALGRLSVGGTEPAKLRLVDERYNGNRGVYGAEWCFVHELEVNDGSVLNVNGQGVSVSGDVHNYGTITVSDGQSVSLGGNVYNDGTITHSGTTTIVCAGNEYVGGSGTGTFTQTGGTHTITNVLYLGYNSSGTGTYELSGTGLLSAGVEAVGAYGTGTFTQTGGENTVSQYLCVGCESGSNGTYELSGTGQLSANFEYIGNTGTGAFTQTGGTHVIINSLYLGYDSSSTGIYELSGTGLLSAAGENVGYDGMGTFTQTGGTHTITNVLYLGYNSSGTGTYELSGTGLLSAKAEAVGAYGTGTFTQTGGTNTITNSLYLGHASSGSGTYKLSGTGQLSANYEYIGNVGTGAFMQTGGTNTISSKLYLGYNSGSSGTYIIPAGSIIVKDFYVGYKGSGALYITDSNAGITVSNLLRFGPNSTLTAVPGTTIHMTGSAFENESTNPDNLAGLGNLTLIFEGGNEDVDPFEAAGEDVGAVAGGFVTANFLLDTLQLGGTAAGKIQLVDDYDNQNDGIGVGEAVYVNTIIMNAGATIDLNGLNLYYLNGGDPKQFFCGDANLDGAVNDSDLNLLLTGWGTGTEWQEGDFNGDLAVDDSDLNLFLTNWNYPPASGSSVPEPASATILLLGMIAVFRRRKK